MARKYIMAKCLVCHDLNYQENWSTTQEHHQREDSRIYHESTSQCSEMQKQDPLIKDLLKKYNNVLMPAPDYFTGTGKDCT